MRICYVSNNFKEHDFKFLKKLGEKGYDVCAFSISRNRIEDDYRAKNISFYEMVDKYPRLSRSISTLSKYNFVLYFLWFFFALIVLRSLIKKFKPDILHGGYVPIAGFLCAIVRFHPFLLMPWGSDILLFPDKSIIHKYIVNYTIAQSDSIICDARTVKEELLILNPSYDEQNIFIFPWGIDLDLFTPSNTQGLVDLSYLDAKDVIISTRNHESIYGNEALLEVVNELSNINSSIHLLLLGSGTLTEKYKEYVRKNKLESYVTFTGYVKNIHLPSYLNRSKVYVSCSYSDGTSVSLLEAMACKLPVIVSNILANKEWIKEGSNGYFFDPGDKDKLKQHILKLINSNSDRKHLANNNFVIAQKEADWNINFGKLETIYNTMNK